LQSFSSASRPAQSEASHKIPLQIIVMNSLAEAEQIIDRLKSGEDFTALALEKSVDPTADSGGYLGNLDASKLRPELRDALRGLGPGQITTIVQIPEGYAVVKVMLKARDEDI